MKKIVLVASGGLANRMRAVASGLTLSQDTGVPLSIIWYRDWGLNASPEQLFRHARWMEITTVPDTLEYSLKWELPRKKNLYISTLYQCKNFSHVIVDDVEPMNSLRYNSAGFRQLVTDSPKSIYIYSGCPFYDFKTDFYRKLFIPTSEIEERVEEITSVFKKNTVGLHIRRTDNVMSRRYSPTSLFIDEINKELALNPDTLFYLASDDTEIKKEFKEKFGDHIIVSTLSSDRGSSQGIKDAFTELLVLSRCRLLLGSWWSSYSMSAPLLGDVELKQLKIE
ncbi:MAG: hypothetical protein K2L30_05555 [Duncaniella sp.]|nr:hypothetical protein [Duncaniella sp.]